MKKAMVLLAVLAVVAAGACWFFLKKGDGLPSFATLRSSGSVEGGKPAEMPAALKSKVLAYWSFDEDSVNGDQVKDLGPGGYHGTIKSANEVRPGFVKGVRGTALNFPKGHEAWVEINPPPELKPPFTLTAWVRLNSRQGTAEVIGQKPHSAKDGLRMEFSVRKFALEYSDGAERITVERTMHQASENQWVFLAVVNDGKDVILYLDGWEMARQSASPLRTGQRPLILGNYPLHKDKYRFVGQMDEMILFNEALTKKELIELGVWARSR